MPKTWPEPKKHPSTDRGERRFDKTQLRESGKAVTVHRDYAAHFFRWGFAFRFHRKGVRSLEVGCGQDQPLIKVLCHSMAHVPSLHVACDLNKIQKKSGIAWTVTLDEFDFTSRWKEIAREHGAESFDVVTCFEVIEHMGVADGRRLLAGIRGLLRPGGTALVSTPVYNEKHMAANHIHEYRFEELRQEFDRAGFDVTGIHGTFMTAAAMKRVMNAEERRLVDELSRFHSNEVLANFLAPKYPEASSNCCWVLTRREEVKRARTPAKAGRSSKSGGRR